MNRDLLFKAGALLLLIVTLGSSSVTRQPAPAPKARECSVPTYTGKALDLNPRILEKPQPKFSSDDRRRHQGQVIMLEAILCGSGKVTDIAVKEGLTDSLNEKAMEAARKIKFKPGEKDGDKVSRFVVLKYFVK